MNDRAVICGYCSGQAKYLPSSEAVYNGRDYGPVWVCWPCEAWVGCHPDGAPLGRLANKELRRAKMAAHAAFDPLWQHFRSAYPQGRGRAPFKVLRRIARNRAYSWLSEQLGIPGDQCHIGMFDLEQCQRVIAVIRELQPTAASIRAWSKQRKGEAA